MMFLGIVVLYALSFCLVVGFDEWFVVWIGLELNMISFLMLGYKACNLLVVEAMGSYFFVQSLASGVVLGMMYLGWNDAIWGALLAMKMGVGPFYGWYIKVLQSLKWWTNYILMIFQKIILLLLMSEIVSFIVWSIGLMSLIIGLFGIFGQINLKVVLGFSSVFHSGWMLLLMGEDYIWGVYLIVYGLMMLGVVEVMNNYGFVSILSSFSKNKSSLILLILNLGGIPPLTGFILKWLSFYVLWLFDYGVLLLMVFISVGMLFVYMRMAYDVMLGGMLYSAWNVSFDMFVPMEMLCFVGVILLFLMN
uniref:NADH-ubiquinone oxidoreductase chain 2 n=1 Tax=Harpactocrates apennicola TaxID=1110479 RepID=A0A516IMC0_9ARAC|nr:NADH dehydrogenase subunit 2 [Harpactocrates apennicola]QDP17917.1 NADH dehydrogenase subunit 2 [Harpactocrates apennicola]